MNNNEINININETRANYVLSASDNTDYVSIARISINNANYLDLNDERHGTITAALLDQLSRLKEELARHSLVLTDSEHYAFNRVINDIQPVVRKQASLAQQDVQKYLSNTRQKPLPQEPIYENVLEVTWVCTHSSTRIFQARCSVVRYTYNKEQTTSWTPPYHHLGYRYHQVYQNTWQWRL